MSGSTKEINRHFMRGGFVNIDTHQDWFSHLENAEVVEDINRLFGAFGIKITRTANGRTWFPVWIRMDDQTRQEIEKTAAKHKKEYRHVICFFRLVLGAISHGHVPQGGAILRESAMNEVIANNSHLVDRLKLLCAQVLASNRGRDQIAAMTGSIIRWAASDKVGLLEEFNPSHGEWRFTGKVDWVNDMNAAFREYIEVPVETDSPENLPLF